MNLFSFLIKDLKKTHFIQKSILHRWIHHLKSREVGHFSKNYFKRKLYKQASADNVGTSDTCKRYHEKGHKSAKFPSCKYHISSKQEKYQSFTRKLPMDKCVANQYVNTLKPIIVSACRDVRNIQKLNNDIPHCIFRQQFWYFVCQLVNAKRVTTSTNIPPNMLAVWNACTELATSYHNNMVEHFESRLLSFLYYRLQNIFMVSDRYRNRIFF
ncbi:hypothetical protein AB4K20DRAFT_1964279 [Rhizopus microsporus]